MILQAAQLLDYNDDFDEEDIYNKGPLNKPGLQVIHGKKGKKGRVADSSGSARQLKEPENAFGGISNIDGNEIQEEDDDDDIDEMAKFIEGADVELIKDHSATF